MEYTRRGGVKRPNKRNLGRSKEVGLPWPCAPRGKKQLDGAYMTIFFYSMEMDELIEPNDTANWRERCGKLEPTALAPSKGLLLIEFNSGGN
jgi:hypothetical protein